MTTENNETLIADLLSYANAFQGRSGTSGYAIAAKNAALAIRNLEARLKDVETHLRFGSPHDAMLVIQRTRPRTEFQRFVDELPTQSEPGVGRCNCGWPRTTDGEHGDSCPAKIKGD